MDRHPRFVTIMALVAVVALACLPQFAERYTIQLFTRIMTLAILAMSLGLLVSGVGLVSLGHAAFFGFGAYVLALASPANEAAGVWWALPLVIAATAAVAAIIGALAVRTSGIYFIMLTLAFGQMLFYLFHDAKFAGGSDGIYLNFRPAIEFMDREILNLNDRPTLFYLALALMVLTYLGIGMVLRAPFGRVILGIRVNEPRMKALGYNTNNYKLTAFVIAGALAGIAGFLYATQYRSVNPALFSWRESGLVLMMVILGGLRSRLGPVIGAFALVLLEELFQALTDHWLMAMGVFIIVVVLLLPDGLASLFRRKRADPEAGDG